MQLGQHALNGPPVLRLVQFALQNLVRCLVQELEAQVLQLCLDAPHTQPAEGHRPMQLAEPTLLSCVKSHSTHRELPCIAEFCGNAMHHMPCLL